MIHRYYYQYREDRLSTCLLTIHGLLHIPEDIRVCGPMWTGWTFYMEQFCGILKSGLHSHVQPWSNLNKRILHMAYLQALAARYDLKSELSVMGFHDNNGERRNEMTYDQCMYLKLMSHNH
jgi:hypothetical protein